MRERCCREDTWMSLKVGWQLRSSIDLPVSSLDNRARSFVVKKERGAGVSIRLNQIPPCRRSRDRFPRENGSIDGSFIRVDVSATRETLDSWREPEKPLTIFCDPLKSLSACKQRQINFYDQTNDLSTVSSSTKSRFMRRKCYDRKSDTRVIQQQRVDQGLTTCAGNWLRTVTSDQTVYNNSSSFSIHRYITG